MTKLKMGINLPLCLENNFVFNEDQRIKFIS